MEKSKANSCEDMKCTPKKEYKFITNAVMMCSEAQFKELIPKLKEMGWHHNDFPYDTDKYDSIIIYIKLGKFCLHKFEEVLNPDWIKIESYNPEHFLALSAMTDKPEGIPGEWWMCRESLHSFEENKLYKQKSYQGGFLYLEDGKIESGINMINCCIFRKATLEEINSHFKQQSMVKKLQEAGGKDKKPANPIRFSPLQIVADIHEAIDKAKISLSRALETQQFKEAAKAVKELNGILESKPGYQFIDSGKPDKLPDNEFSYIHPRTGSHCEQCNSGTIQSTGHCTECSFYEKPTMGLVEWYKHINSKTDNFITVDKPGTYKLTVEYVEEIKHTDKHCPIPLMECPECCELMGKPYSFDKETPEQLYRLSGLGQYIFDEPDFKDIQHSVEPMDFWVSELGLIGGFDKILKPIKPYIAQNQENDKKEYHASTTINRP